jgi:hypothetical protein
MDGMTNGAPNGPNQGISATVDYFPGMRKKPHEETATLPAIEKGGR